MTKVTESNRHYFLFFLVLLAAAVFVDGGRNLARAETAAAPSGGITICVAGTPGLPVILIHELGLFAAEGLTVTLKKYSAGSLALDGLLANECDFATVGETPVAVKSFERQDFSIVATLATSDDSVRIIANKERGISRPEDLRGKRIFVHKGTTNHFFLDMYLARNGLSKETVTVLVKEIGEVADSFVKGDIDAFAATEANIAKSRQALGDRAIVFTFPGLCMVSFNLAAMNSMIQGRPANVRAVLAALLKAADFLKEKSPATLKHISVAMGISEGSAAEIVGSYQWDIVLSQALFLSLEQEARWAIDTGMAAKARIPNYLNFIHREALESLRPDAVTMLK